MEGGAPRMVRTMATGPGWDHVYFLVAHWFPSTVLLWNTEKGGGEGGGALVAKIPSATSKLTQSQEMAEVVFNGAYGKHSNLELLF